MTYREQLNKVNELGFNILDLEIANELDCVLELDTYNEQEFEQLCNYARSVYLKSDSVSCNAIALAIHGLLWSDNYSVEDIISMDKWKFIEKAENYM